MPKQEARSRIWKGVFMEPLLLSVSEAAKKLGLGERTVRELIKSRKLASVAIGSRNYRVPVKALEDYVHSETVGGTAR
jgi:excisionase family DNA binding protein